MPRAPPRLNSLTSKTAPPKLRSRSEAPRARARTPATTPGGRSRKESGARDDLVSERVLETDPGSDILSSHSMLAERFLEELQAAVEMPAQDRRKLLMSVSRGLAGVG